MKYTVVVNKREIEVPYKIYVAHCTQEFRTLQPMSVYNKFLSTYELDKDKVVPFLRTYLDDRHHLLDSAFTQEDNIRTAKRARGSVLFLAGLAEYYAIIKFANNMPALFTTMKVIQKEINFCTRQFSDAYNKLQPLTAFYHSFIYNIDMNKRVFKRYEHFITKKNIITFDDIRKALLETEPSVTFEEIRKDIDNHGILLDMGDHFVWGSKYIQKWFWQASYNDISILNLNKMLSMKIYC